MQLSFVLLALALQQVEAAFKFGSMPAGWTGKASFAVAKGQSGVAPMMLCVYPFCMHE
jgi:hypothetical protein